MAEENDEEKIPKLQLSHSLPDLHEKQAPTLKKIHSEPTPSQLDSKAFKLMSMGELYYREEIKDAIEDDKNIDWKTLKQKLFGDVCELNETNDKENEEKKDEKSDEGPYITITAVWCIFENHLEKVYQEFKQKHDENVLTVVATGLHGFRDNSVSKIADTISTISSSYEKAESYIRGKWNLSIDCSYELKQKFDTFLQHSKQKIEQVHQKTVNKVHEKIIDMHQTIIDNVPGTKKIFNWMATCTPAVSSDGTYDVDALKEACEPFRRIFNVLQQYNDSTKLHYTELRDSFANFEHQQLFNDFMHIKMMHIDADNNNIRSHDHHEDCKNNICNNIGTNICESLEKKVKCDIKRCKSFERHYKNINTDDEKDEKQSEEDAETIAADITFQQELDKMHIFFFHSTIKLGTKYKQLSVEKERMIDELSNENPKCVSDVDTQDNNNTYAGKQEDDKWWNVISEQEEQKQQNQEEIYQKLVEKMGAFRWQNPHGFAADENREIGHYKPHYKNIKEEILKNKYHPMSKENWNQTLRKSKIFFNSWARQKIRSLYAGYFEDQLTQETAEWKKDVMISLEEIVTLKFYTDFDKLQFALKKCFRFETVSSILQHNANITNKQFVANKKQYKQAREKLKERLEIFYHWRGGLLIMLNKFGKKFNTKNNMILYHGVNAKMIIHPEATYAFSGPLSTTSSYHVARTFATAKGMILKITSQFPRLNYCNAFDASSISDYPEEQEWLVGFMYVRLLKVRTRKLVDNPESFEELMKNVPVSSLMREIFFAVHLFNEQIFSMSEHLERIIAQFLKVNRKECCDQKVQAKYNGQSGRFQDWRTEHMCAHLCAQATHPTGIKTMEEMKQTHIQHENQRKRILKVAPMIWKKFNEFRINPNVKQRIKFETISDHLKRFFMDESKDQDVQTGKQKWNISFNEITTVYPKVREIHFVNQYKFDQNILENLIKQIDLGNKNTIKKVVFLYYNYNKANEEGKPLNENVFTDPDKLNNELKNQLTQKGWTIKHVKNGDAGYKIRVYDNKY